MAHLARFDEFLDRARDILDWNVGVDPVLVEEVYCLDAEPAQGRVRNLLDVFGPARQAVGLPVRADVKPELGRDGHLIPEGGKRFPNELLVDERPVHLGGIKEGDSLVYRCPE